MVAGQPEDISQVLANFQAIQAVLNGGIDNSNINAAAAIAYSKIALPANAVTTQQFTTSGASGTYTTPAGCRAIIVELWGAGGGGGGCPAGVSGSYICGGGGAGGTYSRAYIANPAASYAYVVGARGSAASNATGGTGGATSFGGSLVTAPGGGGGGVGTAQTTAGSLSAAGGIPGAAGNSPNGISLTGSTGEQARSTSPGVGGLTLGGTPGGNGGGVGIPVGFNNSGPTGQQGAGGGGAGSSTGNPAQAGGTGGAGMIIVTELY